MVTILLSKQGIVLVFYACGIGHFWLRKGKNDVSLYVGIIPSGNDLPFVSKHVAFNNAEQND